MGLRTLYSFNLYLFIDILCRIIDHSLICQQDSCFAIHSLISLCFTLAVRIYASITIFKTDYDLFEATSFLAIALKLNRIIKASQLTGVLLYLILLIFIVKWVKLEADLFISAHSTLQGLFTDQATLFISLSNESFVRTHSRLNLAELIVCPINNAPRQSQWHNGILIISLIDAFSEIEVKLFT